MSLNKFVSDTPIKDWLNIGCNSLKANSIEANSWVAGDIIPISDNAYDLGTHDKNWRKLYSRAVKDLDAPVDGQDAINYVSSQIMITDNSGIQSQNFDANVGFTSISPAISFANMGGLGTTGLLGLGNLPVVTGSVYEFFYTGSWSGISGVFGVVGRVDIEINNTVVATIPSFVLNSTSNMTPFTVSGTLQFLSGVGTVTTTVNSNIKLSWYASSQTSNEINNKVVCDTSSNANYLFRVGASNTGGGSLSYFNRTIGYVRNVYYPSVFP